MGNKINEIGNKYGNLLVVKEAPKGNSGEIRWECLCDCGNSGIFRGTDLRSGKKISCAECSKKRTAQKLLNDITGQRFGKLVVLKYIGKNQTKHGGSLWECQCDCGNVAIIGGTELRTGRTIQCPKCGKEQAIKKLVEYKHSTLEDLTNRQFGDLTVLSLSDRKNKHGDRLWVCQCVCGNIVEVQGNNLKSGNTMSCGHRKSNGEEKIKCILEQNKIPYIREKIFSTCKDQKELPFDFYINNNYIVEYDGIQHFSYGSKGGWNNKERFENTKKHDQYKNEWCKENNIPLIRIPYTHYDDLCLEDLLPETSQFLVK